MANRVQLSGPREAEKYVLHMVRVEDKKEIVLRGKSRLCAPAKLEVVVS